MSVRRRLKHSDNGKGGMPLEMGRMWDIDRDLPHNAQFVYATAEVIRLVNIRCGEWERTRQEVVHFSPEEARALGEALLDAAEAVDRHHGVWMVNRTRVDQALDERIAEIDRGLAADEEAEDLRREVEAEDLRREIKVKRAANIAEQERQADLVDVRLDDAGVRKIGVIKVVREVVSGLGLKEAKDLVDGAPQPLLEKVTKEVAEEAKGRLEAAGATATIDERLAGFQLLLDQ